MEKKPKRRLDLRRLLSFPLLRAGEVDGSLSEGELLFELAGENPGNLLFGRFDEEEVRSRLERAGILDGLAGKGYPDPILLLECGDPADQRVELFAGQASRDRLLFEARLEVRRFHLRAPVGPFTPESAFRMLIIHWLGLSDPDRPFSPVRPRLPGQLRPGLGVLPEAFALLRDLARDLSLDGVLDVPDHFHAALLYARDFRFLDPETEGRFRAIARDLSNVPLALASEAIELGCLLHAETEAPLAWEPAEQVLPIRGSLRRFLQSPEYRGLRDRAFAGLRACIDWDLYRRKIAERGAAGKYP